MAAAARGGHRHVCELLLASGCPCCLLNAVFEAARTGHEGLMHWLLQLSREGNTADVDVGRLLQAAAGGFNLATLQRLHQQLLAGQQQQQQGGDEAQPPPALNQEQQSSILAAAAGSPTPDWQAKVQWLEGLGYARTTKACEEAAMCPDDDDVVGRLQWLHSRGYPLDGRAANRAAQRGNLAALRFLVEQAGVRPTFAAACYAALQVHLDVLQYLHASGAPMDAALVALSAAMNGHLPVVAWVVETLTVNPGNAPGLLSSAATCGNVWLMSRLLERGWTLSEDTTVDAAVSGCEEALEWMVAQGCGWQAGGRAYVESVIRSDLAMVHCLQRLGCPWGPNQLADCISRWAVPVPMLRCLVELGCPVDWEETTAAAEACMPREYRTAVLGWLGEEQRRRQ